MLADILFGEGAKPRPRFGGKREIHFIVARIFCARVRLRCASHGR